jgi:hypothetical protein
MMSTDKARGAAYRSFTNLVARSTDLLTLAKLVHEKPDLARVVAGSVASDRIRTFEEQVAQMPGLFKPGALPLASDLAPATHANLKGSLPVGVLVLLYVAVDELLSVLLGDLPRRFAKDILSRRAEVKIDFGLVQRESVERIQEMQIDAWLERERERSITDKFRTICSLVKPPRRTKMPTLDEFESLRTLRHDVAHRSDVSPSVDEVRRLVERFSISMFLLAQWVWETIDGDYKVFNIEILKQHGDVDDLDLSAP